MLDLVFVSDSSELSVIRHTAVANPEDKYHPTLAINFFHHPYRQLNTLIQIHNKLHNQLFKIDWINELSGYGNDLDQSIMKFYQILHNCFVACVPKVLPHTIVIEVLRGILNNFQN